MKKNKYLSYIVDGILSGIMICIGAIVLLSSSDRTMGAFLFSLGLFSITVLNYGLFTGKVGYIVNGNLSFLAETGITLCANALGTFLGAVIFSYTRLAPPVSEAALAIISAKIGDSFLSSFMLAIPCGMLMFTAVEIYKKCSEAGNFTGALFGIVMPVMVFIICGFNHCIADMAYYFLGGSPMSSAALVYFAAAILGNAVGGCIIPLLKKFSANPL